MTGILLRRRIGYRHRDTQGQGHVMTEAKIRVMDLAANGHQGLGCKHYEVGRGIKEAPQESSE